MSTRPVEQVEEWDARPFSGGYDDLRDLAGREFSGIVTVGPAKLCMTKGRVVGVLEGSIEDFEEGSGTVYEAPSPALPLLAVMQARGDEVRAQYYTEETPIAEVDRTLSEGNFTGYVELSENVLSGDYYLVYHQGRSMSVAFVGESKRLLTDDEAFERADGEVGIYEVRPVDIDVVDIPEPARGGTAATGSPNEGRGTTGNEPGSGGEGTGREPTGRSASERGPDSRSDTGRGSTDQPDSSRERRAGNESGSRAGSESGSGPTRDPGGESGQSTGSEAGTTPESGDRAGDDGGPGSDRQGGRGGERSEGSPQRAGGRTDRSADDRGGPIRGESGRRHPEGSDRRGRDRDRTGDRSRSEDREGGRRREGSSERGRDEPTGERGEGDTPVGERDDATARDAPSRSERTGDSGSATDTGERGVESDRPDTGGRTDGPAEGRSDDATREPDRSGSAGAGDVNASGESGAGRADDSGATGPADGVGQLEVRTIPSVDPQRSGDDDLESAQSVVTGSGSGSGSGGSAPDPSGSGDPAGTETDTESGHRAPGSDPTPEREADTGRSADTGDRRGTAGDAAEIERLESALRQRETEIGRLESELGDLEEERDALRRERDELRRRVEELESRLEQARAADGTGGVASRRQVSPTEAIDGTNLFVRYRSKGESTLEDALAGNAEKSDVDENLQIQYHTEFETEEVAVDGEPFVQYLQGTLQYRLVEWIVRDLAYEIRDTGHRDALKDFYEALPRVDRAELNGAVSVQYQEDGEEHRTQETFDVVLRDRMGNPLAVVNINDARDPATRDMMESLITAAQRVGETSESLAAAFLVTSSYFEPEAMEAAAESTGSGLLSRDKRRSFVKLSRKGGFHLCLAEVREQQFNLSVPEL